jgi:hypothetical protein
MSDISWKQYVDYIFLKSKIKNTSVAQKSCLSLIRNTIIPRIDKCDIKVAKYSRDAIGLMYILCLYNPISCLSVYQWLIYDTNNNNTASKLLYFIYSKLQITSTQELIELLGKHMLTIIHIFRYIQDYNTFMSAENVHQLYHRSYHLVDGITNESIAENIRRQIKEKNSIYRIKGWT